MQNMFAYQRVDVHTSVLLAVLCGAVLARFIAHTRAHTREQIHSWLDDTKRGYIIDINIMMNTQIDVY
jgi:hypothetical protein